MLRTMKHLLIALVITVGLAFAPLAQAMCKDADCALELLKIDKKEAQTKAMHVCSCHHHSTTAYQLPAATVAIMMTEQQADIPSFTQPMVSALIAPLLEPPSHA